MLGSLIVVAALLLAAPIASAAISVNTTKDELISGDGTCSLREATDAVSGLSAPDCPGLAVTGTTTINLPAGTYHLTLGSGLFVQGSVAIDGPGSDPSKVTINADGHDRVLEDEGHVTISGVTITGGRTFQGYAGDPTVFNGAGGKGGDGAGILNLGTMTLRNVVVTGNRAGNGGAGATGTSGAGCPGGGGGASGSGGGVYNYNQSLTLDHVVITNNRAGDGGAGGEGGSGAFGCTGGAGGPGGDGGGLLSLGQLSMVASTITNNAGGNGGEGGTGTSGPSGLAVGGTGGAGGNGAGVAAEVDFTTVSIAGSTIAGNQAGPGGRGGMGATKFTGDDGQTGGVGGTGGLGGGIYNGTSSSQTSVVNSTITSNAAGDGGYGGQGGNGVNAGFVGGTGGSGGSGGGGGGIYDDAGPVTAGSATIAGNAAGGAGGPGAAGVGASGGSPGAPGPLGLAGQGGSVVVATHFAAALTELDSLISAGTPENCIGPITDGGHDLSFPDTSCPHAVTGDPKLAALGDFGGPTQTMSLQAGSAAIDQVPGSGAGCPGTDQRGVVRPQPAGGACDIGAYEYAPPLCRAIAIATHGTNPVIVQLSCGDPARVAVQYAIVHGPGHGKLGTLGASSGKVSYTAKSGFSGTDQFTYRASDANGSATAQTVTITVAPVPLVISHARLSKRRFRVDVGTKFEFTLSLAARVRVTITHKRRGRTVSAGKLFENEPAGKDSFKFSGRIGGLPLRRGSYTATLVATVKARRSSPVTLRFTIVG